MEQAKLKEILEKHKKWLYDGDGGENERDRMEFVLSAINEHKG